MGCIHVGIWSKEGGMGRERDEEMEEVRELRYLVLWMFF
jgi:hypothetical protein